MTETPTLQTHRQIQLQQQLQLIQVTSQIYIDTGVRHLYKAKGVCTHMGAAAGTLQLPDIP